MICIKISDDDDKFKMMIVGHACYAPKGQDIVCASVSTLAFTLISMLEYKSDCILDYEFEADSGLMNISFRHKNKLELQPILDTVICGFNLIAESNPDYVSVSLN